MACQGQKEIQVPTGEGSKMPRLAVLDASSLIWPLSRFLRSVFEVLRSQLPA
jgi:hypothetical protein